MATKLELAKSVSIATVATMLGYKINPASRKNYPAKFRGDRTPSMSINFTTGEWYDHGIGQGGDAISFYAVHKGITNKEAINELAQADYTTFEYKAPLPIEDRGCRIFIKSVDPIQYFPLIAYLQERGISVRVAEQFAHQVVFAYEHDLNKTYKALGFRIEGGGYVLRYKGATGKRASASGISFFRRGAKNKTICVFEGCFNAMTYAMVHDENDILTLNGVANKHIAIGKLNEYDRIELWLDNDAAGTDATEYFTKAMEGKEVEDMRHKYPAHNDLNDYWLDFQQKGDCRG